MMGVPSFEQVHRNTKLNTRNQPVMFFTSNFTIFKAKNIGGIGNPGFNETCIGTRNFELAKSL